MKSKQAILTRRELDCALLLLRGFTSRDIAKKLIISVRTVETHIFRLKNKLACDSLSHLVRTLFDMYAIISIKNPKATEQGSKTNTENEVKLMGYCHGPATVTKINNVPIANLWLYTIEKHSCIPQCNGKIPIQCHHLICYADMAHTVKHLVKEGSKLSIRGQLYYPKNAFGTYIIVQEITFHKHVEMPRLVKAAQDNFSEIKQKKIVIPVNAGIQGKWHEKCLLQ